MRDDPIAESWIEASSKIKPANSSIPRVYWIAFWGNIGLACFKISMGMLGYSRLLAIDGLNSAANAIFITMILFGLNMSQPDSVSQKYPNGRGKAQYIITLVVGFFIAACSSTILVISIKSFFLPISMEPVVIGIFVAFISIIGNLIILHYLKQSGSFYEKKDIQSIALLQSLNIASSIVVGNSLLLSGLFGWYFGEHIGSISISCIVLALSIRIIINSLDGVMDRSCGDSIESRLMKIALSVDNIIQVKFLRTRRVGHVLVIDFQVGLRGDILIKEADTIISEVEKRLSADLKGISHVINVDRVPLFDFMESII
ncbi:MAG: cation diffusion facilitator family transporter [Desulfamplus sp.]|nr:cation diffusion facilitator family transporter [Desulfamplus sp.]MBF0388960.1 cation diffusion facilitator family transporter [Desulfamplus sp.]